MTTKEMLHKHLLDKGAFQGQIPEVMLKAVDAINTEGTQKMKLAIAYSELTVFTSHLRKPMRLRDGTLVPTNSMTFILAKSGASKDSAMNMVRKGLKPGYEDIEEYRKNFAINKAKAEAADTEDWTPFYVKPKPIQSGLATPEGLISHFASLEEGELAAGYVQSSELGSELVSNANMVPILTACAVGYDLGRIPAKIIKSAENQTSEIKGLPISALLFGSEDGILYDTSIKDKFKSVFSTQMSRRSLFSFNPEVLSPKEFSSVEELTKYRRETQDAAMAAQAYLGTLVKGLTKHTTREPLEVSEACNDLFEVYKEYNALESDDTPKLYPITALSRRHKQWLALKLAGSYAILGNKKVITETEYVHAINTVEIFANDMKAFENELRKEKYEQFVDYMKFISENGKSTATVHELKKLGYITGTGGSDSKLKELASLASSMDDLGIYTLDGSNINYEEVVLTDVIAASFMESKGTKQERQDKCNGVYGYAETKFTSLGTLLQRDLAFSPFKFKDGMRGKDNVISGTKWLCLDIDKSNITAEEAHDIFGSLNHHIARTSDPDNGFKFRLILELDSVVDVEAKVWKQFIKAVGATLGTTIDPVPQSQIFFGYEGREVLSITDRDCISVKDHLLIATSEASDKPDVSTMSDKQKKSLLANKTDTFAYAYDAADGEGSRSLMRAAYHARDLGMSREDIVELIRDISNFWDFPMQEDRLDRSILSQIRRF